jgi:hypothetical protein
MDNLTQLATALVNRAPDPVKDGIDAEESGIPAAYTYLGQFIDHDLTFDPASSLQRQNDPDALIDYRTPAFDLDCVYGRGLDDQPYLYSEGGELVTGRVLTGQAGGTDIQRTKDLARVATRRAVIGTRERENVVSPAAGLAPASTTGAPGISSVSGQPRRFHCNGSSTDFLQRL